MRFAPTYAILLRQMYLLQGSPARFISQFAWIGIDMLLWGFLSRYLNSVTSSGQDFLPALLGAVLLWNFFIRTMQGVTMAFFEDVWSRNCLNMFASPMTITEYVTGLVLSSIATSSVGLMFMIVLARFAFDLPFLSFGVPVFPFLLSLFLFGIALGVVACALVLRMGPAAEWLVWPIPAMISPFAGVAYPIDTLPAWMQAISYILPPAYVFENLRAIVRGGSASPEGMAVAAALGILYVVLGSWVFSRTYRYVVRTGLIARYSAESVS
jgi:ABC-2 type transport system permease protein